MGRLQLKARVSAARRNLKEAGGGLYWSSTAIDEDGAYLVSFDSDGVSPDLDTRNYGFSVRLVTDVPAK